MRALPDLTRVTAEQFTLTLAGTQPTAAAELVMGAGWYYLSAPVAGWAPATSLTNTEVDATLRLPDCATRDALVGSGP